MQFLRTQFRAIFSKANFLTATSDIHTQQCRMFQFKSNPSTGFFNGSKARYWEKQNKKEYEIQQPGEEPRLAEINFTKRDIPVSWKNLWYIAKLIEGNTVDEALKQLSFIPKKGAYYVKDAIKEAQTMAVKEHNVEFKSNLWITTSFPWTDRYVFRGIQRKVKRGPKKLRNHRSYFFLTLREGPPIEDWKQTESAEELFEDWMKKMRNRKIYHSL